MQNDHIDQYSHTIMCLAEPNFHVFIFQQSLVSGLHQRPNNIKCHMSHNSTDATFPCMFVTRESPMSASLTTIRVAPPPNSVKPRPVEFFAWAKSASYDCDWVMHARGSSHVLINANLNNNPNTTYTTLIELWLLAQVALHMHIRLSTRRQSHAMSNDYKS